MTRKASATPTDDWILAQPEFAQPILRRLREQVYRAAPDATEAFKWGRPFFLVDGALVAYMAAFKQHCAFGFWSPQMTAVLAADGIAEPGSSGSFGRITSVDDLPAGDAMVRYIRHAAQLAREGAGGSSMSTGPRRRSAKAPIAEPPEFTHALNSNTQARANFDAMPPSCRREYLEWITSAKKRETRDRRMQQALLQLKEGKRFNEQYQSR